jgi:EAL and modified HD-GYP domain-containing signal transduction protein
MRAGGTLRTGLVHDVRVGRKAVYDDARRLVSYELVFRGPDDQDTFSDESEWDATGETNGEQATSRVIAATFATFGLDSVSDGKPVFITFTRGFLTGVLPIPVEPDNVIIEVTDQVGVDHELLLGLAQLKQAGYRIAVDNYRGDLSRSALVELADFVKIDVNTLPSLALPGLVQSCRLIGATLLAANVEDADTLRRCIELGFELFQGDHLNRPAILSRRMLSPSQLVCVRLLNLLSDPDAPIQPIEQLVGSDPGLAIRLLRSANSSSGAGRTIESLHQALVLIGPRRLRSWVVLTLLEGTATPNTSDDLWSVLSLAHACQRLAPEQSDLAYTVGLLSGAAGLLGTDSATIADVSGVADDTRAALLDGAGAAGRALRAVEGAQREDDDAVHAAGFAPGEVSRIYLEAVQESRQLVHQFLAKPS